MNKAIVMGRLTRDPEKRVTTSGKPVCSFTLAVDRPFKDESGQREADFLPVVVWGKAAEIIADSCKKGHRVLVEGRIQVRNYESKEGQKRYVTEIIASYFEFIERREHAAQEAQVNTVSTQSTTAANTNTTKPVMEKLGSAVPFDEEVPF